MVVKWSEKDVIQRVQEAIMKQGSQGADAERLQKLREAIQRNKTQSKVI